LVSKGYAKGLTELGACATIWYRAKRVPAFDWKGVSQQKTVNL
jgi:hypothetical protein